MSKNVVEPERARNNNTVWRIGVASWIMEDDRHAHACTCPYIRASARTHARRHRQIYNTYCLSTAIVTRTHLNITLCAYCLVLVMMILTLVVMHMRGCEDTVGERGTRQRAVYG